MVVVDPEKIGWETVERAMERLGRREVARAPEAVKRAWVKVLSHDEETGAIALLGKFDKGFHEPKHTHTSDVHVIVPEGKLIEKKAGEIKKSMYWFSLLRPASPSLLSSSSAGISGCSNWNMMVAVMYG